MEQTAATPNRKCPPRYPHIVHKGGEWRYQIGNKIVSRHATEAEADAAFNAAHPNRIRLAE